MDQSKTFFFVVNREVTHYTILTLRGMGIHGCVYMYIIFICSNLYADWMSACTEQICRIQHRIVYPNYSIILCMHEHSVSYCISNGTASTGISIYSTYIELPPAAAAPITAWLVRLIQVSADLQLIPRKDVVLVPAAALLFAYHAPCFDADSYSQNVEMM